MSSNKRNTDPELRKQKKATDKQRAVAKNIRDKEKWLQKELASVVQPKEIAEEPDIDSDEEIEEDIADLPFIPIPEEDGEQSEEDEDEGPTVVYLGHLPFGFEEFQMADYFKQFGDVKRSYISRSKKSGNSKGYGFVQFRHPETAQIAADTMNDYLMFKKRLICRVVPKSVSNKIRWPKTPVTTTLFNVQRNAASLYNSKNQQLSLGRLVEREDKKREKLRKLGINYEFDGYTALVEKLKQNENKDANKREREGGEEERAQKRPREEEKEAGGKGEEEEEGEEEGEEEKGEGEGEDEEALWDARKQTKIAADLTGSQKRKLLTQHITQTRKEKKASQKANKKQQNTPTPTPANGVAKDKTPEKETTPKTPAKEPATQKTPAKTLTPKTSTPPKTTAKETTPKTAAKETAAKTSAKETTPKTPAKETTHKTPTKETTPKTPAKETTPKTPAGKAKNTPSKPVSTPKSTPAATPSSKKKKING